MREKGIKKGLDPANSGKPALFFRKDPLDQLFPK
jgi:hypothetical protein